MMWESGNQVLRLWNKVQKDFCRRACLTCHSRDTDSHVVNTFNRAVVVVACWNCGSAHTVANIRGV